MKRRATGFTLLELVIVIAILGIFAATAASRMIDLRDEARIASLMNVHGTVQAASALVFARSAVLGRNRGSDTVDLGDGTTIPVHSGYAVAHWNQAVRFMLALDATGFSNANAVCNRDWCGRGNQRNIPVDGGTISTGGRGAKIWPRGYRWRDRCGVHYINHQDGNVPEIGVSTSDC